MLILRLEIIVEDMGWTSDSFPFTHLCIPMGHNMSRVNAWSSSVDRFLSRLACWKAKTLSFGGRPTLINSGFEYMGSYLMLVFPTPVMVISLLESLRPMLF